MTKTKNKHTCFLYISKKGKVSAGTGKLDEKGKWENPCKKCALKQTQQENKFLRKQIKFLEKRQVSNLIKRTAAWVIEAFGEDYLKDKKARCMRLLEESIELAQTQDIPEDQIRRLIAVVYSKDKGEPSQELAGCMTTLCATAYALQEDLYYVVDKELNRISEPETMEKCKAKNALKRKSEEI